MGTLLVRTPAPYPTESLFGYVLRVSEANGYDSPKYVWQLAGIPLYQRQAVGFPVEKLAQVLGCDPESLRSLAYRAGAGRREHFKILGEFLGDALFDSPLRLNEPTFCPQCVKETGFIDAFWDLRAAEACPVHGTEAVNVCGECGKALGWDRPGLLTCRCGADLAGPAGQPVEQACRDFMGFIRARVHGVATDQLRNETRMPFREMSAIPLWALLPMLERLGGFGLTSQTLRSAGVEGLLSAEAGPRFAAAAAILSHWPHHYDEMLEALSRFNRRGLSSKAGLAGQFNWFYEAMFKARGFSQHADFLKTEFIRFGEHRWGKAVVYRGGDREDARYVSKLQFSRQMRLTKPLMARMVANGDVQFQEVVCGAQTRVVIDTQRSRAPAPPTETIPVREAAKRLGIPVSALQELRRIGVFKVKVRRGFASTWYAEDVEAFWARGLALGAGIPDEDGLVSLRALMRLHLGDRGAKAQIVAAVFDRTLRVAGRDGQDLGGLLLDRAQADAFVEDRRRDAHDGSYSLPEAARRVGLDPEVMSGAIRLGYLMGVVHRGQVRVTAESVERFNAQYISLARIADGLNTSSYGLWERCRKVGIAAVFELQRRGGLLVGPQRVLTRNREALLRAVWRREREQLEKRAAKQLSARKCEQRIMEYLANLILTGELLPLRAGRPNRAVIARACGLPRRAFYAYPQLIRMLRAHV